MISATQMIQILLISLGETLIFELGFARLWGIRNQKDYIVIAIANILTNPIVVSIYYGIRIHRLPLNYGLITFGMEILAVLVEGLIYKKNLSENRCFLFSLSANSFSYAIGELLNKL